MASKGDALGRGAMGDTPEPVFEPLTGAPQASFKAACLNPPTMEYIGLDDTLFVEVDSIGVGGNLVIRGRILDMEGVVRAFDFRPTVLSLATHQISSFPLSEGFLLDLTVQLLQSPVVFGAGYVQAGLMRGKSGAYQQVAVLLAGHFQSQMCLAWPFSKPMMPMETQGAILSSAVGNPAAGADFIYTVPTAQRNRIISVFFTLTTSAAVATRDVSIIIDDGANILGRFPANVTQLATLTNVYTASAAPYPTTSLATVAMIPLPPDLRMFQAWRLRSSTAALDAADQFSTIRVLNEAWVEQ